jgi:hypothetical protein
VRCRSVVELSQAIAVANSRRIFSAMFGVSDSISMVVVRALARFKATVDTVACPAMMVVKSRMTLRVMDGVWDPAEMAVVMSLIRLARTISEAWLTAGAVVVKSLRTAKEMLGVLE